MKTPPQPKTLTVNGKRYRLAVPFQVINEREGKSTGPSYRLVPNVPGLIFNPDLAYLAGIAKRPTSMNPVRLAVSRGLLAKLASLRQTRGAAKTPRRTTGKRSRG